MSKDFKKAIQHNFFGVMNIFHVLPADTQHLARVALKNLLLRLPVTPGSSLNNLSFVLKELNYFHPLNLKGLLFIETTLNYKRLPERMIIFNDFF